MSKKVAVSACLLGRNCRYDGKNKLDTSLLKQLQGCEVIPFCPEEKVLGTPRETIDLIEDSAIGNKSGIDYSDAIKEEARSFIKAHPKIDALYVKSKSPSCALCSAKVYDKNGLLLSSQGMGLFTKELQKAYKNIQIKER